MLASLVHSVYEAGGMSYELVSLDKQSLSLSITPGVSLTLGRQAQLGVTNKGVSREHCVVQCLKGAGRASVIVTSRKKCYVSGPSRDQSLLLPGMSLEVSPLLQTACAMRQWKCRSPEERVTACHAALCKGCGLSQH